MSGIENKINLKNIAFLILGAFLLIVLWGIFVPYSLTAKPEMVYDLQRGLGYKAIGVALEKQGIIKNHAFFTLYALISGNYNNLQAGNYKISSSMSVADIIKKFAAGDIVKNSVTIVEGWNLQEIAQYLDDKKIAAKKDFIDETKKDWSQQYDFLNDKLKKLSLEGYLFPDTYELSKNPSSREIFQKMLDAFGGKLTPELRAEIAKQKKSIFEIVTMASILEKEVRSTEDKKTVSGILWKRLENNMGLEVDSTINYITGKNDPGVSVKDTQIDSPYNTYKYKGLPLGPISNPGMDSIIAAIHPIKSDWWYYLSVPKTGQTIFSKTLGEHNATAAKYLR